MKFSVSAGTILPPLRAIEQMMLRNSPILIMSNVLIEAGENDIILTGNNFEMVRVERIAAEVERPGAVTVSAALLSSFIRSLPADAQILVEARDDRVTLRCGRARVNLPTLPVEDFPTLPTAEPTATFTIPGPGIARALAETDMAQSKEEARYYLCGTYMAVEDGALVLVATDGHVLSRRTLSLPDGAETCPSVIIPAPATAAIGALAAERDELTVEISGTLISVAAGPSRIVSKLIDGTFPDYQRVIPREDTKLRLRVNRAEFLAIIGRASAIAAKDTTGARTLKLIMAPGTLGIEAHGSATETIEDSIDADCNFSMAAGFLSRLLTTSLKMFPDSEIIDFNIQDPGAPARITDPTRPDAIGVVMPYRLR